MKVLRLLVLVIVAVGAFFYFTTYRPNREFPVSWVGHPSKVEIT